MVKNAAENGYPELERAAYHLWLSLAGVCVAAFFLSLAYFPAFYVLAAIALSLERAIAPAQAAIVAPQRVTTKPVGGQIPAPVAPAAPAPKRVMSGKEIRALMRKV